MKDARAASDDHFRIEEQKSAVATATAVRDPQADGLGQVMVQAPSRGILWPAKPHIRTEAVQE